MSAPTIEPRAGERQQVAVGAGAFVEHALREERQERQHREPEERRRRREHDERDEAAVMPDVGEAAPHLVPHAVPAAGGMCFTCSDISVPDHDEERERVERRSRAAIACGSLKPHLRERGNRRAEGERTEHARDVELDGVERDGVRQILLVDERRNERLIRRAAEGLREPGRERQQQDVPDLDDARNRRAAPAWPPSPSGRTARSAASAGDRADRPARRR